jgi:hypothetical protein
MSVEKILSFNSKDPLYDSEEFRVSLVPNVQEKRFEWKTQRLSRKGLFPKANGVPRKHRELVKTLEKTMEQRPKLFCALSHSLFWHASNSASLLAFTHYNAMLGALLPTGELEAAGRVPFSGELIFSRRGFSNHAVSTYFLTYFAKAYEFSTKQLGWTPEAGATQLQDSKVRLETLEEGTAEHERALNAFEISEKRLSQWNRLMPYEQSLVSVGYPVIYGLRPGRLAYHILKQPSPKGETAIVGRIPRSEIRSVFVPRSRFEEVKELLGRSTDAPKLPIEDIELLRAQ